MSDNTESHSVLGHMSHLDPYSGYSFLLPNLRPTSPTQGSKEETRGRPAVWMFPQTTHPKPGQMGAAAGRWGVLCLEVWRV